MYNERLRSTLVHNVCTSTNNIMRRELYMPVPDGDSSSTSDELDEDLNSIQMEVPSSVPETIQDKSGQDSKKRKNTSGKTKSTRQKRTSHSKG